MMIPGRRMMLVLDLVFTYTDASLVWDHHVDLDPPVSGLGSMVWDGHVYGVLDRKKKKEGETKKKKNKGTRGIKSCRYGTCVYFKVAKEWDMLKETARYRRVNGWKAQTNLANIN